MRHAEDSRKLRSFKPVLGLELPLRELCRFSFEDATIFIIDVSPQLQRLEANRRVVTQEVADLAAHIAAFIERADAVVGTFQGSKVTGLSGQGPV